MSRRTRVFAAGALAALVAASVAVNLHRCGPPRANASDAAAAAAARIVEEQGGGTQPAGDAGGPADAATSSGPPRQTFGRPSSR